MRKFLIILLTCALLGSGSARAQQADQEKQAKAYMVAGAHLDTQWNWDVQTTIKDYLKATLFRNLLLLRQYPDYIFNFEGGVKYSWMKEYYPNEYEQMKEFIRAGRWHICGSSWEASDVLVPSVESSIRNILLGQEYYRKEFGTESTDIYLPDCFGFGWTLPTIASHCGLIGFSSQKLAWRAKPFFGKEKFPFPIGLWKGVDGSAIMFAHGYGYYGKRWNNVDLSQDGELQKLAKRSGLNTLYRYYGSMCDKGGAPYRCVLRSMEKGIKGEGPLKIISATSDQLYKEFLPFDRHPELPVFDGEQLMDVHGTGCYTSQAAMKLYNRQNELLGDAAERASVAADWQGTADYPGDRLTESWKRFIYHQFHDDLTGTSIPRVYEFSWNDELLSLKQFSGILTSAVSAVSEQMDTRVKGIPVVLYNTLGFPVTDVVEVSIETAVPPRGVTVYDAKGKKTAAQLLSYQDGKAKLLIEATVPAVGYAVYDVRLSGARSVGGTAVAAATLDNSVYKISLDKHGDITSLIDKRNKKELVKEGKSIRLALFTKNESFKHPAWEIKKNTIDSAPVSITQDVKMNIVENGALRKTLCVKKRHGKSVFRQYIHLYEGGLADRIDFENEIDWQSTNALLKAEFALNIDNEKATYDLGVGSVQRGNNVPTAYEVYAQYWADLTDSSGETGVSILNDSKYGWDKPDNNTLRLTLFHTPKTKKDYVYQDHQDLGYHTFTYSLIAHAGALDKAETGKKADVLNQRVKAFTTGKHSGALGKTFSLVSSDNDRVVIKALKKAESSDEYVVRVYETGGKSQQNAVLTFAGNIISAEEADGTEKSIGNAAFNGNQLEISIRPNSIKTYKLRLNADKESNRMKHEQLALNYNRNCFSWNESREEANFESGFSYASELIPDEMVVDRIPFRLEKREEMNGMSCKGDTLRLPVGHIYNRLYILAAAATNGKDVQGTFLMGRKRQEIKVPSYTGFIGQWEHTEHTQGYLKEVEVAHTGMRRHSVAGDHAYEFTYMFKFAIDIPAGITEIVLPDNKDMVIFAATLVKETCPPAKAVSTLFRTANKENKWVAGMHEEKSGLAKSE